METTATHALATHIAEAENRGLDSGVADRARQHLLDGLVAMLSGATLAAGRLAAEYAASRGGTGESSVVGGRRTNPELAAFANALSAHADETDDVNNRARIHPGASIIPAAIAVAEAYDRPGAALLSAVSLGYDVACAVNIGAWESFRDMQMSVRTSHGLGQTFGCAAAAASLGKLSIPQIRQVLSYAGQQISGIATFYRDPDHIGKAFATAAIEAHGGVRAAELVRFGFTGIHDVFDGTPSLFDAYGERGSVGRMLDDLRTSRHVTTTDIKQLPVGGPIQAPAEALSRLLAAGGDLSTDRIDSVEVRLPTQGAYIVDNREMPDINLQYILALLLVDGHVSFASSHDYERCHSPAMRAVMGKIHVVPDPALDVAAGADVSRRRVWCGVVAVTTLDGVVHSERVDTPIGSHERPISWQQLTSKAVMTLDEILPAHRIEELVTLVRTIEDVPSTRRLRSIMDSVRAASPPHPDERFHI